MTKKALITGITGQDGSYLAELLLDKGYDVHGIIRRASTFNTKRIDHIYPFLQLHYGDLTDLNSLYNVFQKVKPYEVYNLGAQSHVQVSFGMPAYTGQVDAIGTLNMLEATRAFCPLHKFYQASTSELYGKVQSIPQNEQTPFYPRSPYGVAKIYGYWIVKNYREAYGMHASSGILFNHESPRRGETFVTQKIVRGLGAIMRREQIVLSLGNLNAKRDWGHARDFVEAMWLMLQQDYPDDYVIATGEQYSVRQFVEACAPYFGMEIEWEGTGLMEKGINKKTGNIVIDIDTKYFRPSEVDTLLGDATKAHHKLGWQPKTSFEELVREMCEHELQV